MHMRDVHPFCPRLSPLADCAFPSRERTSDLTIARGRRFLCGRGVSGAGQGGHAWIGPSGALARCSQGWIAVQTFVGSWLGLVLSVWQGDRRIRKMRLP
jgi:hypothetical protein